MRKGMGDLERGFKFGALTCVVVVLVFDIRY